MPVITKTLELEDTDIGVTVALVDDTLTITVLKDGHGVHKLIVDNVAERMEHAWLADCMAEQKHVDLRELEGEAFDYIMKTNVNQG